MQRYINEKGYSECQKRGLFFENIAQRFSFNSIVKCITVLYSVGIFF